MNKLRVVVIYFLIFAGIGLSHGLWHPVLAGFGPDHQNSSGSVFFRRRGSGMRELVDEFRALARKRKAEGYDVSEAIALERRAKAAVGSGNKEEGIRLIKEGLEILQNLTSSGVDKGNSFSSKPSRRRKTVELAIPAGEVIYTAAVPKSEYERGAEIKSFDTAFESKVMEISDGKLSLELGEEPVYLEVKVKNPLKRQPRKDEEDSPFGIHDVAGYSEELSELNVGWVRYDARQAAVWDLIEPVKGQFDWGYHDKVYSEMYRKGINLLVIFKSINRWDGNIVASGVNKGVKLPNDLDSYCRFLAKTVERYDGDGIDDAAGSPVVRYWQIENEPDIFWKDTPEHYARLLKAAYRTIKKADSKAQVVIGAIAGKKGVKFFESVLKHLQSIRDKPSDRFFDVFDLHWNQIQQMYYSLDDYLSLLRAMLDKYGYAGVPVFITEVSAYSDCPVHPKFHLECQTEREQAAELVKLYIRALSGGISKIFWVTLEELHGYGGQLNGYYDNVGLVHNPENDGMSGKKLAFYAYRLLIQKTKGADWSTLERIDTGEKNVYLFKLMKSNIPFYIVWRDNF